MGILSLFRPKEQYVKIIKRYYPIYENKNIFYKNLVEQYLSPDSILLDAGCGAGIETCINYKQGVKLAVGVDLSAEIKANETVHEKIIGDICRIPLKDKTIDIVLCRQLIEHLKYPEKFFKEVSRVLKPKGIFILMTPNLMEWTTLISKFTPYRFHLFVNREFFGIENRHVFPTYYRANTIFRLKNYLQKYGLRIIKNYLYEEPPKRVVAFSLITTYLEIFYTKIVRRYNFLRYFRDIIICVSVKTE